jgi:hypothetical protein
MQPNKTASVVWVLYWVILSGSLWHWRIIPPTVAINTFTIAVVVSIVIHYGIDAVID